MRAFEILQSYKAAVDRLTAQLTVFAIERDRLALEAKETLNREVQCQLAGDFSRLLGREVAYRFEKELDARIKQALPEILPDLLRRYALVPLPDIDQAVRDCVQQVIAERLVALIGTGSITIGAPTRT